MKEEQGTGNTSGNLQDFSNSQSNTTSPARELSPSLWSELVPVEQWDSYLKAIRVARSTGARFMLGGAFGLARYTDRLRNTKDLDFFVLPSDKNKVVDALTKAGFEDYFGVLPYDRGWIYRAVENETIVDTIWQTPNRRTVVDEAWFERARTVNIRGEKLLVIPAEELLCIKLYVMQRDRCDWPDLLNLLYGAGAELDWRHVVQRMKDDLPLLQGLLHVFNWLSPGKALQFPAWLREDFCLRTPSEHALAASEKSHVELLDTRPWFAAFQPEDQPMKC